LYKKPKNKQKIGKSGKTQKKNFDNNAQTALLPG